MLATSSAEAVAMAVSRAVSPASGWRDYDEKLVHKVPQASASHIALDEVISGRWPPSAGTASVKTLT